MRRKLEASSSWPPASSPRHVRGPHQRCHGAPQQVRLGPSFHPRRRLRETLRGRGPALPSGPARQGGAAGPRAEGPRLRPLWVSAESGKMVCWRGKGAPEHGLPNPEGGRGRKSFPTTGLAALRPRWARGAGRGRGHSPNPASRCVLRSHTEFLKNRICWSLRRKLFVVSLFPSRPWAS